MKTCPRCGEGKPASDFVKDRSRRDGLFPYCRQCHNARQVTYGRSLKYGLVDSAALELRSRPCDVCGAPPPVDGPPHPIDHCHETGAVRGVLCQTHNTQLGVIEAYLADPSRINWYLNRGADYRDVDREEAPS